jgi:hypothetical protein
VVVTSGNGRKTTDEINNAPAVLYQADFPLIVVGGTDIDGNRHTTSQGGPKLAVHAPGVNVDVSNKDGTKDTRAGTSYGKSPSFRLLTESS